MKQFTNKEQTRHLIELGFPRPKVLSYYTRLNYGSDYSKDFYYEENGHYGCWYDNYTIGELLSFLEEYVDDPSEELLVWKDTIFWYVRLSSDAVGAGYDEELINALYKYLVELKEEK